MVYRVSSGNTTPDNRGAGGYGEKKMKQQNAHIKFCDKHNSLHYVTPIGIYC